MNARTILQLANAAATAALAVALVGFARSSARLSTRMAAPCSSTSDTR
jgi:hypothetical protein